MRYTALIMLTPLPFFCPQQPLLNCRSKNVFLFSPLFPPDSHSLQRPFRGFAWCRLCQTHKREMVLQTRFSASLACCVLACTLTPHFANAFSLSTVPAARSLGISSTSLSSPAYRLNTPALGLRKYRSFSRITPTAVAEISTPLAAAIQVSHTRILSSAARNLFAKKTIEHVQAHTFAFLHSGQRMTIYMN